MQAFRSAHSINSQFQARTWDCGRIHFLSPAFPASTGFRSGRRCLFLKCRIYPIADWTKLQRSTSVDRQLTRIVSDGSASTQELETSLDRSRDFGPLGLGPRQYRSGTALVRLRVRRRLVRGTRLIDDRALSLVSLKSRSVPSADTVGSSMVGMTTLVWWSPVSIHIFAPMSLQLALRA